MQSFPSRWIRSIGIKDYADTVLVNTFGGIMRNECYRNMVSKKCQGAGVVVCGLLW
ncbi:MAG: hypothetical protein GX054_09705 [Clostridiales bacterium]|nr:hypothetical protein [Clostridiales bacterium]